METIAKAKATRWSTWIQRGGLLITFLSWGANSTTYGLSHRLTAQSTATKWGAESTFKDARIGTKKRYFDELSNDCRLETPRDRFGVKIFAGCWHMHYAVANAIRISTERNCTHAFLFPEQLMTLSDCDLQDQVTKLTKKYSNDVLSDLYRQLLAFRACAGCFTQKAKDPQDILNIIMNLEMFPRRCHGVHDIFHSSPDSCKQWT